MSEIENLSYPIGPYEVPDPITPTHLNTWINNIHSYPKRLEKTVLALSEDQLNTPYRPGGWTVKQLIHHIADSHMNAYIRLKLGLTEDKPTVKPYDQDSWAVLPDMELPIQVSLNIIRAVHERWFCVLEFVRDWKRPLLHPEHDRVMTLDDLTGMYAWHGEHHLAHIQHLIKREGW